MLAALAEQGRTKRASTRPAVFSGPGCIQEHIEHAHRPPAPLAHPPSARPAPRLQPYAMAYWREAQRRVAAQMVMAGCRAGAPSHPGEGTCRAAAAACGVDQARAILLPAASI